MAQSAPVTQSINWQLNAFLALQNQFPPGRPPTAQLFIFATPESTPRFVGPEPILRYLDVASAFVPPTALTYIQPFPSTWSTIGAAQFRLDTPRQAAGTSGPAVFGQGIYHIDSLASLAGPVVPRLGPVTDLTLNGTPFTTERSGVGTQIVLSWQPPALGTVTNTYVRLIRLSTSPLGPTAVLDSLDFSTSRTTLPVPSQLLQANQPYVVQVLAVNGAFPARSEYSFFGAFPVAASFILSPIFTP